MYHLFVGDNYYPMSGLGDYVGPYPSEAEAYEAAKKESEGLYRPDWWVIITEYHGKLIEVDRGRLG